MKAHDASVRSGLRTAVAAGLVLLGLLPCCAQCQISPSQADSIRHEIGSRVEALTILGGDFGLAGGSYRFSDGSDVEMDVSKFGGSGDVGDPRRLGDSGIAWQPTLQGSMGYVDADTTLHSGPLRGGTNEFRAFAIQFGAGARFWFNDRFSLAPTLMAMYGHTSSEYAPTTAFAQANVIRAIRTGLIDWNEGTWTLRPAVNIQYILTWDRTRITLSSDPTFFHTESFTSSDAKDFVNGNSGSLANKIDVDVPLGKYLFGRELHTGGFISRTELFGDLEDGLGTQHLYEVHGRLVLDVLNRLWKAQWIGVGGSYLRGVNSNGWTVGADVAFRF
ncbi:MAG TPA: Solitary outer membrane autotransporter beta-barrel domain [Burkholderiaceae bacterium]